jgi:hypothetical protein
MERKALKLQRKQLQTAPAAVATAETHTDPAPPAFHAARDEESNESIFTRVTAELERRRAARPQTTAAQILANQTNAQKSTGPITLEGKPHPRAMP